MIEQNEVYAAATTVGLTLLSGVFWYIIRYGK